MLDKTAVIDSIKDFVGSYHELKHTKTNWGEPLVRVAAANDPLWTERVRLISGTHCTPEDMLPGAKSVICYFIPFERQTVISNVGGDLPSEEWDTAYLETNVMLGELKNHLRTLLAESGCRGDEKPPVYNYSTDGYVSDWSHKTAAFIAGLGTFGLHNMLITEKGCCGRLGSIVTDLELQADPRTEKENCLFFAEGICGACISRCPAGAISRDGYCRKTCGDRIYATPMRTTELGTADTCGKCAAMVPCSFGIPGAV